MASDGSISFLSVCSMCCFSTECDFELLRAANVTAATVAIRSSMQRVFLIIVFKCFYGCEQRVVNRADKVVEGATVKLRVASDIGA